MGSDLTGFLQQPFVGSMLGLMCILGLLLAAVIGGLYYLRRRRGAPVGRARTAATALAADMPDLDSLVSGLTFDSRPAAAAPAPTRAARQGTFVVAVNDDDTAEAVEVMAILRDVVDGRLIIQMGDKALRNPSADPEFRDRFNRLMREMAQLVRASPAAAPAVESPAVADTLAPPSQPTPPPPRPRPVTPPAPTPPTAGAAPGALPTFRLEDQGPIKPGRGQKLEIKPIPEINIAAAVEAYLQHKLQTTGQYAGRSIHVHPTPDGGVSIEVDGQSFDAVSAVDDPDVRAFLEATIQEWQERH
mgnify:CR=1 FL=1